MSKHGTPTVYQQRHSTIQSIGHKSYASYLKSVTWSNIRKRVWARDKGLCRMCKGPGREVHHLSYDKVTLLGRNLGKVILLCGTCHKGLEFKDGKKVSGGQAKRRYHDKTVRHSIANASREMRKVGDVDREYLAMFRD